MTRRPGADGRTEAGLAGNEAGATAIEYALIASIVAIFAFAGLQTFGTGTGALFTTLQRISDAILGIVGG